MALYHMICVAGSGWGWGRFAWFSASMCIRKVARRQSNELIKQWAPDQRGQALLLSSSLIILQKNERRDRQRLIGEVKCNHAELSPSDCEDKSFYPVAVRGQKMKLLEELRDSLPSSSETLTKIEEAKEKFTSSLHELTERLHNEPLSHIITEQASKITERANIDTEMMAEQVAETLTETLEETREAIQNITQRLVRAPEPGVVKPIATPEPNQQHVDIGLTEEIISQNKKRVAEDDTELMPRFKAAVRQFKAELDADESGAPPISLVSRKAKERIEVFIKNKRAQMQKISEKLDIVKDISVVGQESKGDESVMEYITSNIPHCDKEDPELKDIMSDSVGTFYNDSFLIDDIDIEHNEHLTSNGWTREIDEERYRIWKKCIPEETVTLYKIFGQFDSVSAVEFYNAQVNDRYRSNWDKSVSSLFVVDNITNNREIVYWATKFPFPLQDRDYVFERSHSMEEKSMKIEIASRSITHKSKPVQPKFVRVCKYGSRLVIRADQDLYQKGMRYCLTYYDDFGMPIPNQVKDRLANTKIPEFLEKVHDAAIYLGSTGKLYVPYPEYPESHTKKHN